MNEIIVLTVLLCIVLVLLFYNKGVRLRQKRNIETADKVIGKLKTFSGSNSNARILTYLRKIDPFVFEELLLTVFKKKGYSIERNPRYTHDGGIDGKIWLDGRLCLVQAKRYSSYVSTRHLLEFYLLVKKSESIEKGFFIHTGKTSYATYQLYKNSCVEIVSGDKLVYLIMNS